MITTKTSDLPKSTKELEITIPWTNVRETYEQILDQVVIDTELPGFRKGKAPKKLVLEKIDKTKVYEQVVKEIVPKAYAESLKETHVNPIVSPRIEVLEAGEEKDWKIKATVAVKPKVDLKNYKEKVREFKKGKATKIWVPGKDEKAEKEELKKPTMDELLKVLLDAVEVEFSDMLIEDEANRLLSNLIDQTQKLGMTVEQYLLAQHKTSEQLRAEYALNAARNLKLEFALMEIAESETITVSEEDINNLLNKIEKPEEKETLKKQGYYLASLIRQQKTLDFISNL
ncbi:MAG: Trigger factor [Candidatus Gottesmanbacteria bacterium GW2011_GWC2_39_8]|uniref:Trigger factor n=1 Tax=Candidatus Gottesmanbacteria bacterium GW2011_GWC2_39_8 TaxID=1618450 RepID=A0A0G0T1D7_9BACT|nr:MAG: Trigger factor [Candidatus Gottesmanbacteria bacterium GW2011_GWC2_39_8]